MAKNMNTQEALAELANAPNKSDLRKRLDRLHLSADAKSVMADLLDASVRIGKRVVSIGRKVISLALGLIRTFPNTAFGAVIAVIVAALLTSIPLLGAVLGSIIGPLLVAFGLTSGALSDIRDGKIGERVDEFVSLCQSAFGGEA